VVKTTFESPLKWLLTPLSILTIISNCTYCYFSCNPVLISKTVQKNCSLIKVDWLAAFIALRLGVPGCIGRFPPALA
jgi:hypothetical protein